MPSKTVADAPLRYFSNCKKSTNASLVNHISQEITISDSYKFSTKNLTQISISPYEFQSYHNSTVRFDPCFNLILADQNLVQVSGQICTSGTMRTKLGSFQEVNLQLIFP